MKNFLPDGLISGVLPLLIGTVVVTYFFRHGRRAWQSRQWPRAAGTILQSEVIEVPTARRGSKQYQPKVIYAYEVEGVQFQSDQFGFGFNEFLGDGLFRDRFAAEKFAERYRPGDPVSVAYDPHDHFQAVLQTGINKGHVATLLLGLFCLGIGVSALLFAK